MFRRRRLGEIQSRAHIWARFHRSRKTIPARGHLGAEYRIWTVVLVHVRKRKLADVLYGTRSEVLGHATVVVKHGLIRKGRVLGMRVVEPGRSVKTHRVLGERVWLVPDLKLRPKRSRHPVLDVRYHTRRPITTVPRVVSRAEVEVGVVQGFKRRRRTVVVIIERVGSHQVIGARVRGRRIFREGREQRHLRRTVQGSGVIHRSKQVSTRI